MKRHPKTVIHTTARFVMANQVIMISNQVIKIDGPHVKSYTPFPLYYVVHIYTALKSFSDFCAYVHYNKAEIQTEVQLYSCNVA